MRCAFGVPIPCCETLLASASEREAHGDVLVARRWHDREQRLLACNFGRNAVMLRDIEEKSRICDASILLSTAPHGDGAVLEPNTAVLLAGTASP